MTPQPKERSHSPLTVLPVDTTRAHPEIQQDGCFICRIDGCNLTGLSHQQSAEIIAHSFNSHARLLAQNEMLRKALEEMLHYDSVGCVCPTEEIRSRNPCTTCKARAALEQTEKV